MHTRNLDTLTFSGHVHTASSSHQDDSIGQIYMSTVTTLPIRAIELRRLDCTSNVALGLSQ